MSDTNERLEALERRVAELEAALARKVDRGQARQELRGSIEEVTREAMEKGLRPLVEVLDGTAAMLKELKSVQQQQQARQDETDQSLDTIIEGRASELSTAALLDIYEQRYAANQTLSAWLKSIKANHRYRAVVALRSRRNKSD